MQMTLAELLTLGIALAGLILGIRSEWRARRNDRSRLRVIPKIAYPVGPVPDPHPQLAIEVINESAFAVTVDEVGLTFTGDRCRYAITVPIVLDGKSWPRRLEPRDTVIAYGAISKDLLSKFSRLKNAYASAATGETFHGHSAALQTVAAHGAVPPYPRTRSSEGLPGYINVSDFNA